MTSITFDSLGYVKKLEAAGFTRQQAEAQADALREQTEAQAAALQKALDKYDEASRKDLATKGDIQDVRLEMKSMEMRLLKWQIGIAAATITIMAKGFGWLGF